MLLKHLQRLRRTPNEVSVPAGGSQSHIVPQEHKLAVWSFLIDLLVGLVWMGDLLQSFNSTKLLLFLLNWKQSFCRWSWKAQIYQRAFWSLGGILWEHIKLVQNSSAYGFTTWLWSPQWWLSALPHHPFLLPNISQRESSLSSEHRIPAIWRGLG